MQWLILRRWTPVILGIMLRFAVFFCGIMVASRPEKRFYPSSQTQKITSIVLQNWPDTLRFYP
ncbi:MAG: hypothetical protein ACFNTM_05870 [Cardiobacterium sp.]